jgi:hypothetical protein
MEDKRGIKRERSPSAEGSPVPSDAKTPPPVPSWSPSPLRSPSEVASRYPCSPVFEQGGPSEKAPVIDMSSSLDEEDFIADTSRDFKFAQRPYGELNRDFHGPPGDGKIIILNDSDEEKEEEREEKSSDPKDVAAPAAINPASTASVDDTGAPTDGTLTLVASPADADEGPGVMPNDSSDDLALGPKMGEDNGGGDKANAPLAATPRAVIVVGLLQGKLCSTLLPFFLFCA